MIVMFKQMMTCGRCIQKSMNEQDHMLLMSGVTTVIASAEPI